MLARILPTGAGRCHASGRIAAMIFARRVAFLCVLLTPPAVGAAGVERLPDLSVHLRAARYAPAEPDFHWNGWVGAGAGLLRVGDVTAYFTADVETIIG